MNTLQKCAEILVSSGYADIAYGERLVWIAPEIDHITDVCDPFSDTLEGRRQSDAIEDWLHINHPDLIGKLFADGEIYKTDDKTHTEWRKFNLKWCIQEMIK